MKRLIALGALLALLSACAGMGQLPTDAESRLGKVGVIALIGDEISLAHTGMSGFTSGARTVSVEGWKIDKFVVAKLNRLLRERGYEVVRTDYDGEALSPIYVSRPDSLDWRTENVANELRRIAAQSDADTLILVLRRSSPDFIHETHDDEEHYRQTLSGIGLYDRRTLVSHVTTAAFANLEIAVLDAETLRPVAETVAQQRTGLPERFWHEAYTGKQPELIEADEAALHSEMENVLARTLEAAVVEMRL